MTEDELGRLLDRMGCNVAALRDAPRRIWRLSGGLTNQNFRVDTPARSFVARVSTRGPDGGGPRSAGSAAALAAEGAWVVDREREVRNYERAARTGVGPAVAGRISTQDADVLLIEFVAGAALEPADLQAPEQLARVASACRDLHQGPPFEGDFDLFAVHAGYREQVRAGGFWRPGGYDRFESSFARARAALAVGAGPPVPCHNDLVAANLIDGPAGIRMIDFEYAANNDACFELGNLAAAARLEDEALDLLVRAYSGASAPDRVARCRLFGIAADYTWVLWGSIQHATSPIAFDFREWAAERYEAAAARFADPRFEQILATAAGSG